MNYGKEKCKALKQIRKQIADNNDINYVIEECKHKGKCKGTCPKCEAEVRYLESELEKRRLSGKKVAIAGVSVGIAATFSACNPMNVVYTIIDPIANIFDGGNGGGGDLGGATTVAPDYAGDISVEQLEGEPIAIDPEYENNVDCEDDDCTETDGSENDNIETDDCEDSEITETTEDDENAEDEDTSIAIDNKYLKFEDDYELEGGLEYYPEDDFNVTIDEIF
jgi:hypothetical protein